MILLGMHEGGYSLIHLHVLNLGGNCGVDYSPLKSFT